MGGYSARYSFDTQDPSRKINRKKKRTNRKRARRQDADAAMARKLAAAGRPRGDDEDRSNRITTTKSVEFVKERRACKVRDGKWEVGNANSVAYCVVVVYVVGPV